MMTLQWRAESVANISAIATGLADKALKDINIHIT